MSDVTKLCQGLAELVLGLVYPDATVDKLVELAIRDPEMNLERELERILADIPDRRERQAALDRLAPFLRHIKALDWRGQADLMDEQVLGERLVALFKSYYGPGTSDEELGSFRMTLLKLAPMVRTIWLNAPRFQPEAQAEQLRLLAQMEREQAKLRAENQEIKAMVQELLDRKEGPLTELERQVLEHLHADEVDAALSLLQQQVRTSEKPPREPRESFFGGMKRRLTALFQDPERERQRQQRERERLERQVRWMIAEELTLIQAYRRRGLNAETIPEIRSSYQYAAELIRYYELEPQPFCFEYPLFLLSIGDADAAMEELRLLAEYCKGRAETAPTLAKLCAQMGVALHNSRRMEQAERCWGEALALSRGLAEDNPADYEEWVAWICNNLGILLYDTQRMDEAEGHYKQALSIYRRLAETDPAAFEQRVAMSCNNLGDLLYKLHGMEDAEEYCKEALSIYRRLAETDSVTFEPEVAVACNNLGNLLRETNRWDEAEQLLREALSIRRRLAETEPDAFELEVARSCNNLGALLRKTMRWDEAERLLREALSIRRRLAETDPNAFEEVADTCDNLGALLENTHHWDEAERLFNEALSISRRLARVNPALHRPQYALSCYDLAVHYLNTGRHLDESRALLLEAFRIYARYPHLREKAEEAHQLLCTEFADLTPEEAEELGGWVPGP